MSEGLHIVGMSAIESNRFEPAQMKSGLGWRVLVRCPGNRIQYISGFQDKSDALNWIEQEGPTWFAKMEAALDGI